MRPSATKDLRVTEPNTEFLGFSPPPELPKTIEKSFFFLVLAGPEKGAVFNLSVGESTIGRSAQCDVTVTGRGISRVHAAVTLSADGVTELTDRGSTNGVFVGEVKVQSQGLKPGDTVSLGPEVKLRFEQSTDGVNEVLDELYTSSKVDLLTGLLNRRAFEERLDEEFSVTKRHGLESCIAILDIDHFKSVNDTHGHDVGDQVLTIVAQELKSGLRAGDILGRWGGEEFVLYIRQANSEGGQTLVNRMRRAVEALTIPLPGGDSLKVTFSSGLTPLKNCSSWRAALKEADLGLYEAKEQGRNRVVCRLVRADA